MMPRFGANTGDSRGFLSSGWERRRRRLFEIPYSRLMADDSQEQSDRRDNGRGPIELKVEYKRVNAFFADYTKNISKDGTFIKTGKPLGIGTEFVFKLFIPNLEAPLQLHGQVKWIIKPEDAPKYLDEDGTPRDPGMGIRFIYTDDAERRRLQQIVEELMVGSLGPLVYNKLMERSRGKRSEADPPENLEDPDAS
jgi:type IV pilus assembly protein PilZ